MQRPPDATSAAARATGPEIALQIPTKTLIHRPPIIPNPIRPTSNPTATELLKVVQNHCRSPPKSPRRYPDRGPSSPLTFFSPTMESVTSFATSLGLSSIAAADKRYQLFLFPFMGFQFLGFGIGLVFSVVNLNALRSEVCELSGTKCCEGGYVNCGLYKKPHCN